MSSDKFESRPFLQASALLFVCSNLASIFQFLFQSVMRRELASGEFSLMNSLFGAGAFIALPIAIWTQVGTRKFAELKARDRLGVAIHHLKRTAFYVLVYAGAICVLLLLFIPALQNFFNTDNHAALLAFVFGVIVAMTVPTASVLLVGMQAFPTLSLAALLTPALRLVVGWALLRWGFEAAGGVWATNLQGIAFLVVAIMFFVSRGLHRLPIEAGEADPGWKAHDFWIPAASVGVMTILLNTDFVLVQHLFTSRSADRFATAAVFGHSMVFFLLPVASVLLPKVVDHFEGWKSAEQAVVRKALCVSFAVAILMAITGSVLAGVGVRLFTGAADPETVGLVRGFLWAMIPSAMSMLAINALVGRLQGGLLLACLVLSFVLPAMIIARPGSLSNVLIAHALTGTLLLVVIVLGNLNRLRNPVKR